MRIRPLRSGSSRHRHRLEALSAVYLQRLTELLATGEQLPELAHTGLAVTRVGYVSAHTGLAVTRVGHVSPTPDWPSPG